ncbi:hypothetical protein J5Y03_02520 [Bacillus sp. RG28]|uniref:Uncharacterized protein n=1 Tax=Gottfriedia endophytica TaxID=2820819 RepID=A0A940NNI7_9BACI|nr:hypothetical protein [Gottfriedia endophytica]MBP0724057.1 hypothetical protein [Gottfriedia endophytica]
MKIFALVKLLLGCLLLLQFTKLLPFEIYSLQGLFGAVWLFILGCFLVSNLFILFDKQSVRKKNAENQLKKHNKVMKRSY